LPALEDHASKVCSHADTEELLCVSTWILVREHSREVETVCEIQRDSGYCCNVRAYIEAAILAAVLQWRLWGGGDSSRNGRGWRACCGTCRFVEGFSNVCIVGVEA
jgi:hypothetical protein